MIVYPVVTEHMNAPVCSVFLTFANRALITAYPFVMTHRKVSDLFWFARNFGDKPVILDSGLYTLLRDRATKGPLSDAFCIGYFNNLLKLMKMVPKTWILVELDLHIFKSRAEMVDGFRKVYVDEGLDDRVIHVWHLLEGTSKLPEYWDKYARVACSHRELMFSGEDPKPFIRNVRASKSHWKNCHTHMLGTANLSFVKVFNDSFSCDATSWNAIVLYGETKVAGKWVRWDTKTRRLKSNVPGLVERVESAVPTMTDWYKRHPDYKRGSHVRRDYTRQLAAGFLLYTEEAEKVRHSGRGCKPDVFDPIDFWKE